MYTKVHFLSNDNCVAIYTRSVFSLKTVYGETVSYDTEVVFCRF